MDLAVVGGTVVTESWSGRASVLVRDGRVEALVDATVDVAELGAKTLIDATGMLVLPGGVDPHCHLVIPLGSYLTLDSFETASLAALAGGTTTIVDFAIPVPGEDPVVALDAKRALGAQSRCDYALHGCLNTDPADVDGVIDAFVERGVRTVKLFTTYRGELMVGLDTIESVMTSLKRVDGLTYIHAEENGAIEAAQANAESAGHIDAGHMPESRPEAAEESAVASVIGIAERTGAPVYFVHQSIPVAVDLVDAARRRGVRAFSETCPHYVALDDSCYAGDDPERFVCCPPIRHEQTRRELAELVARGRIHTIGSDHCCYSAVQKQQCAHDVRLMPNGLPGVETRLSVVWSALVATGQLSPEGFIELMCAGPARLNGLYPRKGTIAPGSDADLVIFDPALTRTVRTGDLHMETDYTPYEGREVTGWPTTVVLRGQVVYENGELRDPGPVGQFLASGPILAH